MYARAAKAGAQPERIVAEGFNPGLTVSGDGKAFAFERTSLTMPAELFAANSDGSEARQHTHHNDPILAKVEMNAPETFWFDSKDGTHVQAMLIRPPHFDATKKDPLLVMLHGAPTTTSSTACASRW